jgi:hypothetical protein
MSGERLEWRLVLGKQGNVIVATRETAIAVVGIREHQMRGQSFHKYLYSV